MTGPDPRVACRVNPADPTPGTADLLAGCMAASAYDLNLRVRDEGWPDAARRARAGRGFDGTVVVGNDLMAITVDPGVAPGV